MKRILIWALILTLVAPLSLHARTQYIKQQNSRFQQGLLQNAIHYLENLCLDQLSELSRIAESDSSKNGDWDAIRIELKSLQRNFPGNYAYLLPDGSHYTPEQGKTQLNLRERSYFLPLFKGEEIRGEPVYSRSSGKRSIVLATPIENEKGEVVGALSVSLFLEEIRSLVEAEIPFPKDYTWFLFNDEGEVLLDCQVDYLFMNVIPQESSSLTRAIEKRIETKQKEGEIKYELRGGRHEGRFARFPELDWTLVVAHKLDSTIQKRALPENRTLGNLIRSLQKSLEEIDIELRLRVREVNGKPFTQKEIRREALKLLNQMPQIIEVAYVDPKGVLRVVEPADYRLLEGADASHFTYVKEMLRRYTPLWSGSFITQEGYQAALIAHPLYNEIGQFAGAVSVLFRPELIIEKQFSTLFSSSSEELIVLECDGTIVYSKNPIEHGRNLLSDPDYDHLITLRELAKRVVEEPRGTGMFLYSKEESDEKEIKRAQWDSICLHGRQWRVIRVRPEKSSHH